MQPTDCPKCEMYFMKSPILQAEARHLAVKYGASEAEEWVNERLAGRHEEHEAREQPLSPSSLIP